jgi:menaquinol-cytochrome c reductase iron-sulfur subunit
MESPPPDDDPPAPAPGRRRLLQWVTGFLGAAVGGLLGVPAAWFLGHPLRRETVHGGEEPIAVAELARLPEGIPVRATVVAPARYDAWVRIDHVALGAVWLIRRGTTVTAYSSVCPHAGCFVDFADKKNCFECPCHGSVFGLDGAVQDGPSPRPLDTLTVEVEGGKVLVRYQRFRQATARKEAVG